MIALLAGSGVRNSVLYPLLELPKSGNRVSISFKIPRPRFRWRLVALDLYLPDDCFMLNDSLPIIKLPIMKI